MRSVQIRKAFNPIFCYYIEQVIVKDQGENKMRQVYRQFPSTWELSVEGS